MGYVLNKLCNVTVAEVTAQLEKDAASHAANGLNLDKVWQNADGDRQVYFLFKVDDLAAHKAMMEQVYRQTLKTNPQANLPEKVFLIEV